MAVIADRKVDDIGLAVDKQSQDDFQALNAQFALKKPHSDVDSTDRPRHRKASAVFLANLEIMSFDSAQHDA